MLRISRRAGERIMLGDDTIIEVLEVRGQTVRIGIDAPRAVPVYREEIWLEVKRENQAAAEAAASGELPDWPAEAPPSGAADQSAEAPPSGAADQSAEAPPSGAADQSAEAPPSGAADQSTTPPR